MPTNYHRKNRIIAGMLVALGLAAIGALTAWRWYYGLPELWKPTLWVMLPVAVLIVAALRWMALYGDESEY